MIELEDWEIALAADALNHCAQSSAYTDTPEGVLMSTLAARLSPYYVDPDRA